jgi:xanthine dehydrogenase molybdenum-binding subunit
LIRVEYNPYPFVLSIQEAIREGAPRVFADRPNVQPGWGEGFKWYYFSDRDPKTGLWTRREKSDFHGFGDVEKGFSEADLIVEDRNLSQGYARVTTMEPRGCVASYDADKLTVWIHSQGLHNTRNKIARTFHFPVNKINVISPFTGGSFGGKSVWFPVPVAATLALGRPVKLVYTREEEMLCGWARGNLSHAKLGFKADGRLTTMDLEHWVEVGPDGDGYPIRNVYRHTGAMLYARHCQHLRIIGGAVFTNRFKCLGWHGYGCPESNFMVESVMDEAAYALNLDPVELRRINKFKEGDPMASPRDVRVSSSISSTGFAECLDRGSAALGWGHHWQHFSMKEGRYKQGIGMAMAIHGAGDGLHSSATVKVFWDGTVQLECAIADMGQGQHTVQSQIVAETIGVPYENVRIVCCDTDSTPYATYVHGSQGSWHQGKATYLAALRAKQQLLERAARAFNVEAEELEVRKGIIVLKSKPETSYSFAEALGDWTMVSGTAETYPDGLEEGKYPREQGAQFCRLAVDTETGVISLLDYVPTQYVGRALNPKIVAGQIHGGVYHGLEAAFLAECITDPQTGKLLTYNWENYKPMTMLDFPLGSIIVEKAGDASHPFGAVACGEGAINPVCAVCANAVYNATGVRLKTTPFTPNKFLEAIGKIKVKERTR